MNLEYWQAFQGRQIQYLWLLFAVTLLAVLYFTISLRYYRRDGTSKFDQWFGRSRKEIGDNKIRHLLFSSLCLLVGVVYCSMIFASAITLQRDIKRGLPTDQIEGTVTATLCLIPARPYIILDDVWKPYISGYQDGPLLTGKLYRITYLRHSREILQIQEIND